MECFHSIERNPRKLNLNVNSTTNQRSDYRMAEATYKVAELAAKARQMFGTTPEVVTAALKIADKESATVEDAQKIIQEFLNREVK